MSRYLQDYLDVSELHELDALSEIIRLIKTAIALDPSQDSLMEVDTNWRASIDIYGTTLDLCVSQSDMMPRGLRERAETDSLLTKIIGMLPTPTDIYSALPLTEPELCVLIIECYNEYDELSLEWELYVRDEFLKLSSSKPFRNALAAQKLRLDTSHP